MAFIAKNQYRNPFLSDGELLLRAEVLLKSHNNTLVEIEWLEGNGGDLDRILELCHYSESVARELRLVRDALEENSYESSRFKI
ncbi:hypothetical protein L4C33_21605 [Vibrio makurazakiensis]|uniref:hypothetical protein n=1 Tax=Vibrio makurazakiensis TaxID=2910250 RepID=UPI003D137653